MTGQIAAECRDVYEATVYHDTEDNAAESMEDIGYFPTLGSAVKAVNAKRSAYWQTGGVTHGRLHVATPGQRPERFELGDEGSWFVGIDGKADR